MQQPDNPRARHTGLHLHAELAQHASHNISRARFPKGQFGVLVQIPAPAHKLRSQALGLSAKLRDGHDSLNPP
jgi:hypothetical protein